MSLRRLFVLVAHQDLSSAGTHSSEGSQFESHPIDWGRCRAGIVVAGKLLAELDWLHLATCFSRTADGMLILTSTEGELYPFALQYPGRVSQFEHL